MARRAAQRQFDQTARGVAVPQPEQQGARGAEDERRHQRLRRIGAQSRRRSSFSRALGPSIRAV